MIFAKSQISNQYIYKKSEEYQVFPTNGPDIGTDRTKTDC
jgi:hypothetical protein